MKKSLLVTLIVVLGSLLLLSNLSAEVLFDRGSPNWKWRPGITEASTPVEAWRALAFNDSAFTTAPEPFWYGDVLPGGTQISGMMNVYGSIFLRKTFVISNLSEVGGLRLGAMVDDGFVAWINGTEVRRVNMPGGAGTAVSISTLASNAAEPPPFTTYDLLNPAAYLVTGTNVLAVQVFQSALSSSDLGFDCSLETLVAESIPPTIASVTPTRGSTIGNLTEITVTFSEPVSGVAAAHLLVNGIGAANLTAVNSSTYTFGFVQPPYGTVNISWSSSHNIFDQSVTPNRFDQAAAGASWTYALVDSTKPTVAAVTPAAGSTLRSLTSITVLFSEAVLGVNAPDLLLNGNPATGLTTVAASQYSFTFSQPATGTVQVAWAGTHGIVDTAVPPNTFAGGAWTYSLDPNARMGTPYISEFMASNTRILADENGFFEDWIEIYNPGGIAVNLDGWSLTDNAGNLDKWRFPATNLAGGSFLVVFASGNDRRIPGARLHTSFQLSAGGEYLALVHPDGTVASEINPVFPQQMPDVSYGVTQAGAPPEYTTGNTPVYFTTPTPNTVNLGGTAVPGPIIENVQHTPNVPLDHENLIVTARVRPSFRAVGGVTMRYRIMFSNEVSTAMFDDGAHGDGVAGDGVYGATIPASASTNGQMIRYLIAATDVLANASRWPLFTSPTGTEEYLGTIVNPTNVTSKLPIFHLFVAAGQMGGIDSESGGRISFFYDGEFYDNVYMELRGNTSAGLAKKAHRLEFNRGHELRHAGPGGRTRKSSLLAEYLDPAYLRQHLCFWFLNQIGVPAPFDYPVRVQMNGQFYQLAFHNDVIGQEQVERMGYDPKGALYKAVGNLVPGFSSTGVFQKLEPDNDPSRTDYLALANGINESASLTVRRNTVFDLLDVPQVINHLSGARWSSENDDVWANMSIYRDTFGDGLWRCIPFDMNASWGQLYGGSNPLEATVDGSKSHPLYGGSSTGGNYNRLYDVIVTLPETRQMLLRRERSILDQMVQPPGTPADALILENYIKYMTNLISVEANLDRARWGFSPWASGKTFNDGVGDLLNQFVALRRSHWYVTHNITNTSRVIGIRNNENAGIPQSQPPNAAVTIFAVEFNPSSANQSQEYVCVTNPTTLALDISGWKLEGGVNFTFKPGTVIAPTNVLFVSPNTVAFRSRTTGPRGGQGLFVVGPYQGQLSARGETLTIVNKVGQTVNNYSYPGAPSAAQRFLRVTELMYHPSAHAANTNAEEFEYIELRNISTDTTVSLNGVRFLNGVDFSFTGSGVTSLAPGARVLVVKNLAAFTARYGSGFPVAGQFTGNLDNSGERLQLLDATNEEILDFSFNNSWYQITDGLGFSLVVVNESAPPDDWGHSEQWRPSGTVDGGPGVSDPEPAAVSDIEISEILTHTDLPVVDQIELFNPTGVSVNVAGWWLTDDFNTPKKYQLPAGSTIPAGGYLVISETEFNAPSSPTAFSLSSKGDEVYLFSGNGSDLTGYYQGYSYGAAANGVSFGRYVNSQTNRLFVAQSGLTLGGPNAGPSVGPVVISEINYRPVDLPGGLDNDVDEYIELFNLTGAPIPFYDPAIPANTWRMRGGVDFDFPSNGMLPAGGYALLVNFNPTNASALGSFRSRFQVPGGVPIFGPYDGHLDNAGERIRLLRPDAPDLGEVPYILVDEVEYGSQLPWPSAPDGVGPTLQRIIASAFGNDVTNWTGVGPSAGSAYVPGGNPPVVVNQPGNVTAVAGKSASFSVTVSGSAPFFYQWRMDGRNIYGANNSILMIPQIAPTDVGAYSCIIFNSAGSTESSAGNLTVVYPPAITQQPADVKVFIKPDIAAAPTTNATFSAGGTSSTSIRYQWHFNGSPIPNATNASYTVVNVQTTHYGQYQCAISDSVDTVLTTPAVLYPMIRPAIVTHPASQTVAVGSPFGLSVAYTGFPGPFTNEWRRGSTPIAITTTSGSNDVFALNALPTPGTNSYRVVVKNVANPNPGVPSNMANIVTLADADGDGIPDVVETALGLNPNSGADGAGDLDGDKMVNRDEYLAGTDPQNASSYLKVEQTTVPGTVTISVAAIANRSYTVQYSDDLSSGLWNKLGDIVAKASERIEQLT
ncbi:MAG TPA: lamin tail domain-containing protein, partial [Verrucomicrobiae bacterium]|nr:lamin tail domain-containing protein [Verrucomicrobiae bacterium]